MPDALVDVNAFMFSESEVEAWQALAAYYGACGLASQRLAASRSVEEFLALLPVATWMRPRRRTPAETPAVLLTDLFYHGLDVAGDEVAASGLPDDLVRRLLDQRILMTEENRWRATRKFIEYRGRHVVCDSLPPGERMPPDFVMPPSFSTMSLARSLSGDGFGEAACNELGCGTGLLGLCFAAGTLVSTDLNPRAVACAALNARINGREASFATADWVAALRKARGAAIFNTPSVPALAPERWVLVNVASAEPNGLMERYLSRIDASGVEQHALWCCLQLPRGCSGPEEWLTERISGCWHWSFLADASSPFSLSEQALQARRLPLVCWLVEDTAQGPLLMDWLEAHGLGSVRSGVLRLVRR